MTDNLNIQTSLRAANIARQAEWDPSDKITLTYRLNELAGETGEACNVGKKIERERLGIRGSRDTVEHLAEELADVVICADLVAMAEGIDLDAAVAAKFNATSEKVGLTTRLAALAPKGGAVKRIKCAAELQDELDRLADQFTDLYGAAKGVTLAAWTDRHGRLHGHEAVAELERVLNGPTAQPQGREVAHPMAWKLTPSDHLFGRTIRPEDVDHLEAGTLLRFYSSDPWFDPSDNMPTNGEIVRFTGKIERERFPAVPPHLEVAALDGRVYSGGGWQCHLFQFTSPPDTKRALTGGAV